MGKKDILDSLNNAGSSADSKRKPVADRVQVIVRKVKPVTDSADEVIVRKVKPVTDSADEVIVRKVKPVTDSADEVIVRKVKPVTDSAASLS